MRKAITILSTLLLCLSLAYGQGKTYYGWVVEDPWGSYYLYNGCYVNAISKDIKASFKAFAGKAIEVSVLDEKGHMLASAVRIDGAEIKGEVPIADAIGKQLNLNCSVSKKGGTEFTTVWLELTYTGSGSKEVYPGQLTYVIVRKRTESDKQAWVMENDASVVVHSLQYLSHMLKADSNEPYKDKNYSLKLLSGKNFNTSKLHKLEDGEYFMWAGYGDQEFTDAPSLMSAPLHFRIKGGILSLL